MCWNMRSLEERDSMLAWILPFVVKHYVRNERDVVARMTRIDVYTPNIM